MKIVPSENGEQSFLIEDKGVTEYLDTMSEVFGDAYTIRCITPHKKEKES